VTVLSLKFSDIPSLQPAVATPPPGASTADSPMCRSRLEPQSQSTDEPSLEVSICSSYPLPEFVPEFLEYKCRTLFEYMLPKLEIRQIQYGQTNFMSIRYSCKSFRLMDDGSHSCAKAWRSQDGATWDLETLAARDAFIWLLISEAARRHCSGCRRLAFPVSNRSAQITRVHVGSAFKPRKGECYPWPTASDRSLRCSAAVSTR
jgi:hypothetical protein